MGKVQSMAPPFRLSQVDEVDHRSPPLLGQHTLEVLAELDYDADEIDELQARNIVG